MYWLTHFGTTALPQYDSAFSIGPAPADEAMVGLVGGGVFDAYGTGRARQKYPLGLRYNCSVVGASESVVRTEINALKALIGTHGQLWRTEAGAAIPARQWCYARLVDIDDSMRARMPHWIVPIVMAFTIKDGWKGLQHRDHWHFDAGYYFDAGLAFDSDEKTTLTTSPQTVVVDNDGNIPVRDATIYVTAGSSAITYLKIGIAGVTEFYYDGTIAAGTTLTINCKAKSVLNVAASGWTNFHLTANHLVADWLVLEPGNNSVVVTTTGGGTGSAIEFQYSDTWA